MLLHLVRHGPPAIDPTVAASAWPLDPTQLASVDRLRDSAALPSQGVLWFSSTERKAIQTATRLYDGDVVAHDALREATRPAGWSDRAVFVDDVTRSLLNPDEPGRPGWETSTDVRTRLLGLVQGEISREVVVHGADQVVLVGHGTAWTILVAALTGDPPDVAAWQAMAMPDHCVLDVHWGRDEDAANPQPVLATVVRPWGRWQDS